MVTTRSRQGNNGLQRIKELGLVNKKMINEIRMKKAEEEKKKKAEAKKAANPQGTEDVSNKASTITSRNLYM